MERGARRRGAERTLRRMGRGGGAGLRLLPFRLRRAVRRGRFRPTRAGRAQRASAIANSRPARSAPARLRSRARRRARRNDLAAGGRDRRLPQSSDARSARPFRAGAAHRPDRARFRRRARRAPGDRQPREKARRRADGRLAISPAHGRRRRRGGDARTPRARGEVYIRLARALDRPKRYRPAPRPAPQAAARAAPEWAKRHAHRDAAARSLRGVRRIDPAPASRWSRSASRRGRARSATSGTRRCKRSPKRCLRGPCPRTPARGFSPSRARALRRCSPTRRSAPCAGRASSARTRRVLALRRRAAGGGRAHLRRARRPIGVSARRRIDLHTHGPRRPHRMLCAAAARR